MTSSWPTALTNLADRPGLDVPAAVSRSEVERALAELDAALQPAGPKDHAVFVRLMFDWLRTFGLKPEVDAKAVTREYREALEDLPADLLVEALVQLKRNFRYTHRAPNPAEVRAAVSDELSRRRCRRMRLDTLLSMGRFEAEAGERDRDTERMRMAARFSALLADMRTGRPPVGPRSDEDAA